MESKVVVEYDYYTLDQATEILAERGLYTIEKATEIVHAEDARKSRSEALCRDLKRQEIRREQMEERRYYLKQKCLSAFLVALFGAAGLVMHNPTWILPMIPFVYVFFTKEKWIVE